jgi:hypothetical protein
MYSKAALLLLFLLSTKIATLDKPLHFRNTTKTHDPDES